VVLAHVDEVLDSARGRGEQLRGSIRIACSVTLAPFILPEPLADLADLAEHPSPRRTVPPVGRRGAPTHRTRQLEDQRAAAGAWQEHGLVFTTEIGTPLEPRNRLGLPGRDWGAESVPHAASSAT
jgi:hypothetical protein